MVLLTLVPQSFRLCFFVHRCLYNLLTDRVVSSNVPKVLIACNKHDLTLAKGSKVIQAQLEKEM